MGLKLRIFKLTFLRARGKTSIFLAVKISFRVESNEIYRNMKSIFTILGICQWSKTFWAAPRKVFWRLIKNFRRLFPFVPWGNRPPLLFCTGKNARVAEPDCPRQVLQEITSPRIGKRKERKRDNKQTNKTNERNEFPFYIRLVTKSINVFIFMSKPDGFRMLTRAIKCHMSPRSIWLLSCVQPGTDLSYPKIWLLSGATSLRGIKGACPWIW